jgi:ribosomal-protein-alanine N-acetyltransferase
MLRSLRLYHQRMTEDDRQNYLLLVSNPDVMRYISNEALNAEIGNSRFGKVLQTNEQYQDLGIFAVHEIGTGSYVGLSKLTHISSGTAELGYALLPDFWGKGYGTEISQRMLELAYSIPRLHTLEAYIHPDNTASQHILEKCGFQFWKGGMKNNMLTSIFVMKIIR